MQTRNHDINNFTTQQLIDIARFYNLIDTISVAKSVSRYGRKTNKSNYIARARVILKRAIRKNLGGMK